MTPDDPRHGTNAGYWAGCREACCRRANARYAKGIRYDRLHGGRSVPALGSQRRIQALAALGWSYTEIAAAAGMTHRNHIRRIVVGQKGRPCRYLSRKTAAAIAAAFDKLSMTIPDQRLSGRTRAWARRQGWAPPLAWDDDTIDDPTVRPAGPWRPRTQPDDYDEAVVTRILARDVVPATYAERVEVVRRWPEDLNELERITGWNVHRYIVDEAVSA
ncbi:MAG: hypothetical protein JWO46_756 [Nocardioidaceae bacterium]|nr:hypothetical protein [Nocardioidaceae bacterium]